MMTFTRSLLTLGATATLALVALPLLAQAAPAVPFSLNVSATVRYDKATRQFDYAYQLQNARHSRAGIDVFGITYDALEIKDADSPKAWTYTETYQDYAVFFWFHEHRAGGPVKPGATLTGYRFASPCLPTTQAWFASAPGHFPRGEATDLNDASLNSFFKNAQRGETIGPGPAPMPARQTAHWLAQWPSSGKNTRWLQDAQTHSALALRMQAAEAALASQEPDMAREHVESYLQELTTRKPAQPAGSVLKAAAESLLDQLRAR